MAWANVTASRAIRPEQISSWMIAGMASRVCSRRWRCTSLASVAAPAAVRLEAPLTLVMWPIPSASNGVARADVEAVAVGDLEHPDAPELGELLVERHPPEEVGDAVGHGRRRVLVQRFRGGRHGRGGSSFIP